MPRDLGIADRIRKRGVKVVEVAGWQSRGSSSFNPRGSVNHHTAGSPRGNAPSLNICIHGRSDVPGPLCHVLQARDNTAYVIAAGRANHAGSGGYRGLSGNSSVWGLEVENVGTGAEPWRDDQIVTMGAIQAALIEPVGDPSLVCQHKEWTRRKIDAYGIDGNDFRHLVAGILGAAPPSGRPPTNPMEEILKTIDFCSHGTFSGTDANPCVGVLQRTLNHKAEQNLVVTEVFDEATSNAVRNVQRFYGHPEDGIADPEFWDLLKL